MRLRIFIPALCLATSLAAGPLLAQEVVLSTPLHYRGYAPGQPLWSVQGSGDRTANITEFRDPTTGAPVTWMDFSGKLNAASITSPGALSLTAGGTNQNIILRPSGTGTVVAPNLFVPPEMDNQILTSAVDASGNPAFLTAGAGLTLNILGATTNLQLVVAGRKQTLSSNVTLTLTATSNQFIYVTQDVANAALVAADFGASALPPDYDYVAPAAPATDQHWFNLSDNQMYRYSGAAWVAVNRIFLGVARTSGAAIDGVVCEPYRLSPQKRFELFGNASDGILEVTGTTTLDIPKQYSFVRVDGAAAVLQDTGGAVFSAGVYLRSQNPLLIINSGKIDVSAHAVPQVDPGTGAGGSGNDGGYYFAGAGGGGGGSNINAGGRGGRRGYPSLTGVLDGGYPGGGAGVAGTAGADAVSLSSSKLWGFTFQFFSRGSNGGNGAGDGTNNGGRGGRGGSSAVILVPSILVNTESSIISNGEAGTNGAGGDAGGGGGGGGGMVLAGAGFVSKLGTISANGGAKGLGVNSGKDGGAGGKGQALTVRLW